MRELKFKVTDQELKKDSSCNFDGIVKGSKGYLFAVFSFNSEWDGTRRVAVFKNLGKKYYTPIIKNRCEIPAEALTFSNFKLSVLGENDSKRILTNELEVIQCQ